MKSNLIITWFDRDIYVAAKLCRRTDEEVGFAPQFRTKVARVRF